MLLHSGEFKPDVILSVSREHHFPGKGLGTPRPLRSILERQLLLFFILSHIAAELSELSVC